MIRMSWVFRRTGNNQAHMGGAAYSVDTCGLCAYCLAPGGMMDELLEWIKLKVVEIAINKGTRSAFFHFYP
jgi:hypothetical protein